MALTLVSPLGFFPPLHNVKATEPIKRMSVERMSLTNGNSLKERGYPLTVNEVQFVQSDGSYLGGSVLEILSNQ